MIESIYAIVKSTRKNKKYAAEVGPNVGKTRIIHFGDSRYEQYKDSTPVKAYSHKDHSDPKRRKNYFMRHSGVANKTEAVKLEINKSNGKYNAKILSHKYLW